MKHRLNVVLVKIKRSSVPILPVKWAMPLNFSAPEVEEQQNSSGVREKNGGIL